MLNRGLAVTGTGIDFNSMLVRISQQLAPSAADSSSFGTEQTINMEVSKTGHSPNHFLLRKGVPVKWIIDAKELTQCNRVILAPSYRLTIELKPGVQVIEFTPAETGLVSWSCWMGMVPGTFVVVDDQQPTKPPVTDMPPKENAEISDLQSLLDKTQESWQILKSFLKGMLG